MQLVEFFSAFGFGMTLHPGTRKPRMIAESPSKVSHEVCDWQKLFSRLSHTCAWVVACERPPAARSFRGPGGGTKIEVSHERFNWLKNSQIARVLPRCILLEVGSTTPYHLLFQPSSVSWRA